MKFKFLILAFLMACSKQDFENDIAVPKVLKDYHEERKAEKSKSSYTKI